MGAHLASKWFFIPTQLTSRPKYKIIRDIYFGHKNYINIDARDIER